MKRRAIGALLTVIIACVACVSEHKRAAMDDSFAELFIVPLNAFADLITGGEDLAYATAAFRRKTGRWPTNQTEITTFVAKSEGYLAMRDYDTINFATETNGAVHIDFVPHGRTNEQHLTISTNLQARSTASSNALSTPIRPETTSLFSFLNRDENAPEKFSTYVGGFLGPKYTVEFRDGFIYYSAETSGKIKSAKIKPSSKNWKIFRRTLDEIGIWHWQNNYGNDEVSDGTQWRVEIRYHDRSITAKGSNNYPKEGGTPNNDSHSTKTFDNYCKAIRDLIRGQPFQ